MIIAKLIGALLGIPFGPFGILMGFIGGMLVDQVLSLGQSRKDISRFLYYGEFRTRLRRLMRPGSAIALLVNMLLEHPGAAENNRALIIGKVRDYFHIRNPDMAGLQDVYHAALAGADRLDIDWLIRVYGASSPEFLELSSVYSYGGEADRDFLFNLMHTLLMGRDEGITPTVLSIFLRYFQPMGLSRREIRQRLSSVPMLNRESLRLLGLDMECTETDLKRRYRELAAALHPDSAISVGYTDNPGERGESDSEKKRREEFSRLYEAYRQLLWQFRLNDQPE